VIQKSSIRLFSSNGKALEAAVIDETGELKIVAFNEQLERFYNNLQINKVIGK